MLLALLAPWAARAQSPDCNGPITITADSPYIEDFESPQGTTWNEAGPLPDCWEAYTTGTVAPHNTHPNSHSGFQALSFSKFGINYAILPEFGTDLNQLQISFWKTKPVSGNGQLILGYLTSEDDGTCNTFTEIATYEVTFGYDLAHQSLLNVPTTAKRLAFKWAADGRCCIDDVIVALDANCYPEVGTLSLGGVTTTSAYLSWSLIDNTQDAWNVQVATDRAFTENVTNHVADSHENYIVEGLSPGTEYYVRVKPLCSISFWSNVIRLWTSVPCGGPITITADAPYIEGFESPQGSSHYQQTGPLPTCWEGYNSTGGVTPHNTTGVGFLNGLQYLSVFEIGDNYALLPEFSNPLSELQVSFWMQTFTSSDGQLQLGYLTAEDDGTCNTFTPVATYANSVDYVLRTTYLPNVPVTAVRLAFKWNGNGNLWCHIDDVEVSICTLDCFPVGNMSLGEVSYNSAYLSWDLVDDSQTAWDVQVSTNAAFTNILVDEETDSHENYLLSGLSGSTHYYVRVRANCDDTHQSEWSNAIDFTTLYGPITITAEMPYFEDFESPEGVPYNWAEGPVPVRWGHYTTGNVIPHIVKNDGLEGSQALMFYPNGDNYAILPEFSNPLNELQISFCMLTGGDNAIVLQLGYLTTEDDGTCNTFTGIDFYNNTVYNIGGGWIQFTTELKVPATAARLVFKWSGNYMCFIDDMEVSLAPDCSITITADSPYFESFEAPEGTPFNYEGRRPDCWLAYRTTINGLDPHNSTSWHHDGLQSLAFYNWNDPVFAILPQFSNPISDLQVSFWMRIGGVGSGQLRLGYITPDDNGTCNTFTEIASYNSNTGSMVQRNTVLGNVSADAWRLVFKWSGDGYRCFVDDVEVSINPAMIPPHNIAAVNITPNSADITWEGYCDSYALRYREIPTLLKEGFEGGTMPEGWTIEGINQDPATTWRVGLGDHSGTTGTHSGDYNALITHNTTNQATYLVTPALDLGEYASAELSFWYVNREWSNRTDEFAVCYRIGNEGEWNELWSTAENHEVWTSQTVALTGLGDNYQLGFRFTDHYGWGVGLDDIALCAPTHFDWIPDGNAQSPHTLTSLTPETTYEVQLQGTYGSTIFDWSESVTFTTLEACPVPFGVEVSDIAATSATVSWTGFSDSYNLSYRRAPSAGALLSEGFEGGTMPDGWTIEGDNQDPAKTWRVGVGDYSDETGTHSGNYNALITHNTSGQVTYLVTPALDLGDYGSAELSFWYVNGKWVNDIDEFAVCYRIGNEGEWNVLWSTDVNHDIWTSQTVALTGLANNYQIGFRFTDGYGYGVALDDIVLFDPTLSEWITLSEAESPQAIVGLTPETEYEVKMQGVCDGEATDWSEAVTFTTLEATTFTKEIAGYGESNGGYYLIASPVAEPIVPSEENGFLANAFDLYYFDQSEELEWRNHKNWNFNLENGKGYLYANSEDVTLTFIGTPNAATEPVEVALAYDPAATFAGWNLVGNPFGQTAYIGKPFYAMNSLGTEIIPATGNSVGPMEGIFVVADEDGETVAFSTTAPETQSHLLSIDLIEASTSRNAAPIDRVIIRFGDSQTLPKFQLNANSTKVYIPQGGKDYAIVSAGGRDGACTVSAVDNVGTDGGTNVGTDGACTVSTMPINFKANENGTYTLVFNLENLDLDYLHLIDNLTGADVDLLASNGGRDAMHCVSTYTFTAKTTDYASRFRLVFSGPADGSSANQPFAYIANDEIIINDADARSASLQVVDVMGRVIRDCTDVARNVSTQGMTAGVYVLRLVNGDSVRTQKIVIE